MLIKLETKGMYGKEAAGSVFGCEAFTDLLSCPSVGDIQMTLERPSSVNSLSSETSPGDWEHSPAGRFKAYPLDVGGGVIFYGYISFGSKLTCKVAS